MPWTKLAPSIRLVMAMFSLIAGMEENWGKAFKKVLMDQYPAAKGEIQQSLNDSQLGHKLLSIALKQNQYDHDRAADSIQDLLRYWTESKFDFTKASPTWEDALDNMFSNLRLRAMTRSQQNVKRKKREKSVDDAFGKRGEEGGAPEGGEGRMPTPDDSPIGQALDDKAGVKEFIDLIDEHIPDLKASLPEDERKLFELVFDDGIGSFGSDVKENMSQATALKEKYPDLYTKNQKRWSGFVGDLRKKLLESIWKYIDSHLSQQEYNALKETFFADVDPAFVRRKEKEKTGDKADYQQGIDERKLSKWKWMDEQGSLDDKNKKSYENLKKKLQGQGVDVDAIPAQENPQAKGWSLHSKRAAFDISSIADRIARSFSHTG